MRVEPQRDIPNPSQDSPRQYFVTLCLKTKKYKVCISDVRKLYQIKRRRLPYMPKYKETEAHTSTDAELLWMS